MFNFTAMHLELANTSKSSLCSLSLIDYIDDHQVNEKSCMINPPVMRFSKEKSLSLGLTASDFENTSGLCSLWEEIYLALDNRTIVGVSDLQSLKQKLYIALGERYTFHSSTGDKKEKAEHYAPCLWRAEDNPYFKKLKWQ